MIIMKIIFCCNWHLLYLHCFQVAAEILDTDDKSQNLGEQTKSISTALTPLRVSENMCFYEPVKQTVQADGNSNRHEAEPRCW